MNKLFCDLKTDEEKANFFLSGRGYETGVIALAIQNDVAMAYQRCAEYRREIAQLREQQTEPAPREPLTADDLREPKNGTNWRVEWWNESARLMLPANKRLDSFQSYKNGTLIFTLKEHGTQPADKEQSND